MPTQRRTDAGQRGAVLLLALGLIALLLVVGTAILRIAGKDRMEAARLGTKERAVLCAEAGLQYGRRFFGTTYETTHNWNDYLDETSASYVAGYRFDPRAPLSDAANVASRPLETRGKSDGADFDAGADLDQDGSPDFWVSIRDDDDERPGGILDNPRRDNNERVILRSECTSIVYDGIGGRQHAVVESIFAHVQGASGYGNAQITSNSPDIVGQGTN
jgi:hypothetical protein